jgi:hypothetical protein
MARAPKNTAPVEVEETEDETLVTEPTTKQLINDGIVAVIEATGVDSQKARYKAMRAIAYQAFSDAIEAGTFDQLVADAITNAPDLPSGWELERAPKEEVVETPAPKATRTRKPAAEKAEKPAAKTPAKKPAAAKTTRPRPLTQRARCGPGPQQCVMLGALPWGHDPVKGRWLRPAGQGLMARPGAVV